ncbi:MAG TPA: hypothetical protein VL974_04165 [Magnetospirillum sp.]|jgi:hypothetical protein|nr:hypothetical protein [Magnetospirillum sp.]
MSVLIGLFAFAVGVAVMAKSLKSGRRFGPGQVTAACLIFAGLWYALLG